jgi:dTMP kinase
MVLISIEGIDGSGKSSLHVALGEEFSSQNPVMTREPGATWIGDQVRRAIAEQLDPMAEALLFVADHAAHLATIIRPALNQGHLVITDRYIDSRIAYQGVSLMQVREDPVQWLTKIHKGWTILPDMTLLLIIPPDVALTRIAKRPGREHFEERDFLSAVQEQYLIRAEQDPNRFVLIDATKEPDEILHFAADSIRERFFNPK